MRILQVSSASEIGGAETHVIQLVKALRRRGHIVAVAGRRDGPLDAEIALPFRNSFDAITALRLRSEIRRGAFEVVHAHVARDYPLAAAAAVGLGSVTVVCTRHLLYPVHRNPLYKRIDGWIAPTERILRTLGPVKPTRSVVIQNWVDLDRFPFRPHELHTPLTIGLIGQVSPHKGHDDAVEAMRRLGNGFRLIIAGKGDAPYEAQLRARAQGLPVEFAGFVRLPDFFAEIDVLIAPSWNEPFGIVTLEAMASGIPVIATGPAEVVCGVIVPARNPEALAQAVQSLRHEAMRERARRHVEEHFDMEKIVPRIEEFYCRRCLSVEGSR